MKCHWCDKESKSNYCSPICYIQHDRRFSWWMNQFGLKEEMTDEQIKDILDWQLFEDGSVASCGLKGNETRMVM